MPMVQTMMMMRYKLYPHLPLVLLPLVQRLHPVLVQLLLAQSPMVFGEVASLVISRHELLLGLRSSLQLDYVRGIPITLHFWVK